MARNRRSALVLLRTKLTRSSIATSLAAARGPGWRTFSPAPIITWRRWLIRTGRPTASTAPSLRASHKLMRFGLRSGHPLPLVLTAFCCLLSFCACNREQPNVRPASSSEQIVKHIQTRQGQLDATVWRDEILAQEYEKTFTKLADDFRKAENKLDVLATFEFQTIRIPPVKGSPV